MKKIILSVLILTAFGLLAGCAGDLAIGHALSAKGFEEKGQYDEAIQSAKQSTQLDPTYAPGWYWLGLAYFRKGNYEEAIPAFKKVIELKPAGPLYQSSYNILGWSYYLRGVYDEAINYFAKSLEISPKDTSSLTGIGWSYYWKADYDAALKYFNKVLEITVNEDALLARAWAYFSKGLINEAYSDADKAISLNPQKESGYRIRGWVQYFRGNYKEALHELNLSTERIINDSWASMARQHALRGKAFSYLGLGDTSTALSLVRSANDILNYDFNHDLSLIYFVAGDKDKAWEYRGGKGWVGLGIKDYKKGTVSGVEIVKIIEGSPAEKAGMLIGDAILKLNNADITGMMDFVNKAKILNPGLTAKIKVLREGIEKDLYLQVASAEALMESDWLIAPIMAKKKSKPEIIAAQPSGQGIFSATSDVDELPAVKAKPNKNSYAIVIGIENYRQKLPKADYAIHDAQTVSEYLIKVMGYSEENVVTLLNDRALKSDMEKYFEKWLSNNVEKNGSVFIYYSGHGAPNPKTGDAYLVPYDGDPSFIDQTGYSLKRLYESLGKLQVKEIIVALDSCFSGAGGRSVLAKGARPLVMTVESATIPKNTVVMSAASGDQISSTYEDKGHGLFTYFMLKGIKGEGDINDDGKIEIGELFDYIKPQVERIARKTYNNEQSPQLIVPEEKQRVFLRN